VVVVNHHVDGRSLRLQTAIITRLSSGWSWRMAQVVPPHYLHKYIHKRNNIISAKLKNEYDEIKRHIIRRYLRFTKRFTRIMAYGAAKEHFPVIALSIHIPERNRIQFNLNTIIRKSAALQTSPLEA
jgi:hypothetical protein